MSRCCLCAKFYVIKFVYNVSIIGNAISYKQAEEIFQKNNKDLHWDTLKVKTNILVIHDNQ